MVNLGKVRSGSTCGHGFSRYLHILYREHARQEILPKRDARLSCFARWFHGTQTAIERRPFNHWKAGVTRTPQLESRTAKDSFQSSRFFQTGTKKIREVTHA